MQPFTFAMTVKRRAWFVLTSVGVLALMVPDTGSLAQQQFEIERRWAGIVRVRSGPINSSSPPAAGVVVGLSGGSIYVITARHVLKPEGPDSRACATSATVGIPDGSSIREFETTLIRCHATIDLALIELTGVEAANWRRSLPSYDEADVAAAAGGYRVLVAGYPGGERGTNATGSVTRSDLTGPAPEQVFYSVTLPLEEGFSGGAVFTNDLRLVGIHLEGQGAHGFALRWSRIREELRIWNVVPTLVTPPKTPPYLVFAESSLDTREEAARATLRRYVEAIRARTEDGVVEVWPNARRSELRALLGDARSIEFRLTECGHIEPRLGSTGSITCAYVIDVSRRTGPTQTLPSVGRPTTMTFDMALNPSVGAWKIQGIR